MASCKGTTYLIFISLMTNGQVPLNLLQVKLSTIFYNNNGVCDNNSFDFLIILGVIMFVIGMAINIHSGSTIKINFLLLINSYGILLFCK